MEPSIPDEKRPVAHSSEAENVLERQVREIFGRTVYSHKTHEKCAEQFLARHSRLNTAQIILSAITTGSLLLAVFGDNKTATVIGAVLSTILFAISAYIKDNDYGKLAQRHAEAAHQLWGVREDYFSLLTDLAGKFVDTQHLREQREHLQQRLDKIYSNAPRTTSSAYGLAQKALQQNEELTFSDKEIDNFLPEPLKRSSNDKQN